MTRFARRSGIAARREPLPPSLRPAPPGRERLARPRAVAGVAIRVWILGSLLLHALMLAVMLWSPTRRAPEQLPAPAFDIVFEGGQPERPEAEPPPGIEAPPTPPAPPEAGGLPAPPSAPPAPPPIAPPPPQAAPRATPVPPVPTPASPAPPVPAPSLPPTPALPVPAPSLPPTPAPPVPAPVPTPPQAALQAPPAPPRPPEPLRELPPIQAEPILPLPPPPAPPLPRAEAPQPLPTPPPPPPPPTPARPTPQTPRPAPPAEPTRPAPRLPPGTIWAPQGLQLGRPSEPSPPAGRRQSQGLDLTVDPRIIEGRATADPNLRVTGAQVGADWRAAFRRWLDQNMRYPPRAIELGEQGTVRVQVVVGPDGRVRSTRVTFPSGSPSLNVGTVLPFSGAQLPAFPPPVDPNGVTIDLTVNYFLIRR